MSTDFTTSRTQTNGYGAVTRHQVTVICGIWAHTVFVSPRTTVADVRACWLDRLNIPADSLAVLDGNLVDEETLLQNGQVLSFIRRAGEIGGRPT